MLKNEKGFTLIELLIVVAILGILAAAIVPNAMAFISPAKQASANTEADTLRIAVLAYQAENNGVAPENVDDVMGYLQNELIGVYIIEDGEIVGIGGYDDLIWEDGEWVKSED